MKTYRVTASYMSYCYVDVQAESEHEAIDLAGEIDRDDFIADSCADCGWEFDTVMAVEPEEA